MLEIRGTWLDMVSLDSQLGELLHHLYSAQPIQL